MRQMFTSGSHFSSAPCSPGALAGSQTFHSSKQIVCLGTVGGTLFSILARSIKLAVISIARSAFLGAGSVRSFHSAYHPPIVNV